MGGGFGDLSGAVEMQGGGHRRGQRIGDGQIGADHAAQRAAGAGDLGHQGAAAGQSVIVRAVGDEIDGAGHGDRALAVGGMGGEVTGDATGRGNRGVHFVDGFHAGGAGRLFLGGVRIGQPPHTVEHDDLAGVAAHDGRRHVAERFEDGGARGPQSRRHGVEHPRFALVVQPAGDVRQGVLVERQQCADVDVGGATNGRDIQDVVRQITHRGGAAGGQLRVGHQVDGHEVRERLGQRRGVPYSVDRFRDASAQRMIVRQIAGPRCGRDRCG